MQRCPNNLSSTPLLKILGMPCLRFAWKQLYHTHSQVRQNTCKHKTFAILLLKLSRKLLAKPYKIWWNEPSISILISFFLLLNTSFHTYTCCLYMNSFSVFVPVTIIPFWQSMWYSHGRGRFSLVSEQTGAIIAFWSTPLTLVLLFQLVVISALIASLKFNSAIVPRKLKAPHMYIHNWNN